MTPVTRSNKKNDLETPVNQSLTDSSRGVQRSAEEGEKEKNGETNREKRGRTDMKEMGMLLEKVAEKNQHKEEETGKELIETHQESSGNSHSETSFMGLSDDNFINIFSFLDLPTRLKLRVNKRLDRIHFSVKAHLRRIHLRIARSHFHMTMDNYAPVRSSNVNQLEKGLRRFADNTIVPWITINTNTDLNEQQCRIIDALFHFKSDWLSMDNSGIVRFRASHLTLPSFLTLAQNVINIEIDLVCPSLSAQELCTIRKSMIEGCRMEMLSMYFESGMRKPFIEECFGVTIEQVTEPDRGTIYRSANDSLEIYQLGLGSLLYHYEDKLKTNIGPNGISFEKLEEDEKPHDKFKIKWDHVYALDYDDYDDSEEEEEEG